MKALKITKFQIHGSLTAIKIYYAIVLFIITLLAIQSVRSNGNTTSSGFDFATIIFLFVHGLNSFKSNFKFTQANNISRKTFINGLIIAVFPIAFFMSMLDLMINRIYNIFAKGPTNYDMLYGGYRQMQVSAWTQSNDIFSIVGTFTWQFAAYSMFFLLGILISLIYYRSNHLMKVMVSISPLFVIFLINITPNTILKNIGSVISIAFGWQSQNSYIAIITFGLLGAFFAGFIYLLTRRAEVRE